MTNNTVVRGALFQSGISGFAANQNQHIVENNICFGQGQDSTTHLPCIAIYGNHRSIVQNNNIEGYRTGIKLNGWACQTRGNSGEQTRKFLVAQTGTKGCYFNDIGRSSPNAANGDTLYIVQGTATANTFILSPMGGASFSNYAAADAIRFTAGTVGSNTIVGSTVTQPYQFTMPLTSDLLPTASYQSMIGGINYYDQLEGKIPDSLEYWNGSAWTDWSGAEDFVEASLNTTDYVSVDSTHKKIRVWYSIRRPRPAC